MSKVTFREGRVLTTQKPILNTPKPDAPPPPLDPDARREKDFYPPKSPSSSNTPSGALRRPLSHIVH